MKNQEEISEWLISYLSKLAAVSPEEIDTSLTFNAYGLDSTAAAGMTGDLAKWLGVKLKDSVVLDHPTIDGLSAHVSQLDR